MSLPRRTYLLLLALSVSGCFGAQEVLSFSYLDEYLVPSAKLALSRIQETFNGAKPTATPTLGESATSSSSSSERSSVVSTTSEQNASASGELLRLPEKTTKNNNNDTTADDAIKPVELAATSTTTTTTTTEAAATSSASGKVPTTETGTPGDEAGSSTTFVAHQTEDPQSSDTKSSTPTTVDPSEAEARAAEAEAEAVQAVDASIGFGQDPFGMSGSLGGGGSLADSCYDEYGNARYCEPPFENAAFERPVEVSSVCGSPPSRFCTAFNDQLRNCHMCNAQNPKKAHPAAYLTDAHNPLEPSCWVSGPLNAASSSSSVEQPESNDPVSSLGRRQQLDNVSVQLNLNKRYEIVYVSLQFCSVRPDSLAIYKSNDFGLTWHAYQYYSSHCERVYGKREGASSSSSNLLLSPEAECSSSSKAAGSSRVAFSPLDGRNQQPENSSSPLHDWVSATNIRITLDRHQPSWLHHHTSSARQQQQPESGSLATSATNSTSSVFTKANELTSPSDSFNYALADLTVGARCKCNGHASRCIHNVNGQFQCDCRHNTAGSDCERCAPFHFDRPWARATQRDASPCQPCNCNGHSRKCVFDAELYQLSGRRSGGVCINCRDNTAGRFCHYCKEGFTRDHSRSMSDKDACKHCDCHPIGSLGRVCNQTTGQCPCKEGVAGTQCNLCAPGYQQSSSLTEPCIKLPENDINYDINTGTSLSSAQTDPVGAEYTLDAASRQSSPELSITVDSSLALDNENLALNLPKAIPVVEENQAPVMITTQRRPANWRSRNNEQGENGRRHSSHLTGIMRNNNYQPHIDLYGEAAADPSNYQRYNINPSYSSNSDNDQQQFYEDHEGYPIQNTYYQTSNRRNKPHTHHYPGQQGSSSRRAHNRPALAMQQPILSVASVDRGNNQDLDQDQSNPSGSDYRDQIPIYPDQFNVIYPEQQQQQHRRLSPQTFISGSSRSNLPGAAGSSAGISRSRQQQQQQQLKPKLELSCNDCQSSIKKKPSYRQFCQSKFVIKATVVNLIRSDDWTRVDVEVQDIFKSFGTSSVLTAEASVPTRSSSLLNNDNLNGESYLDNNLQLSNDLRSNSSFVDVAGAIDQMPVIGRASEHRIKIGTIQTLLVPTEDLDCRCPRLKEMSTYLLMGSVESVTRGADSSTVNKLHLDRHGLALEWKPVFLERLARYQHRQNGKGRCFSRM